MAATKMIAMAARTTGRRGRWTRGAETDMVRRLRGGRPFAQRAGNNPAGRVIGAPRLGGDRVRQGGSSVCWAEFACRACRRGETIKWGPSGRDGDR
jgi:hypothetical protein